MLGVMDANDKSDLKENFMEEHVGEQHRAFVFETLGLE